VAQICRGLEGMPLAIELVAALMDVLVAGQIAERLDRALGLLRSGSREAIPRHQTLRATLSWSFELLGEPEQSLFGRLSVFAGGFSLEAVEAVGEGEGIERSDVLESLLMLVDKSLVVAGPTGDRGARYRLLEPVRQYARERLEQSGEADAFRRRHAEFFLGLAEEAAAELTGAHQQEWAKRLEAEHDNMRAALSWSLENEPETTLRLAGALARLWEMRARFLEGSAWFEAALRQSGRAEAPSDAAARAKILSEAGTFAWHRGDYEYAIVLHGEALELYRELGDDGGVAFAILCLGTQYLDKGDLERSAPFFEEALATSRRIGERRTIAMAIRNLAEVARQKGEYERAKTLGMECLSLYQELGDDLRVARTVGWMGLLTFWSGDDQNLAEGFLKEGLALNREIESWDYVAYCLEGFAGLAGERGQGARAAQLWGGRRRSCALISVLPPRPKPGRTTSPAWPPHAPGSARRRGKRCGRRGVRCRRKKP
ncbi:MAG TPA: tetratricopeptide repeat protein, partial [Rubrobacter sp.]|nr:tetratricopeptide repeat protein [Rubrobacter sp.]